MSLQAGARLGPYEILSPLGAGGMGEVYRGRDTRLDRSVAVKVLAQHLASTEVRQRFEREARAISSLSHPHICTLYDVGREGDTDFLVMELLEGQSLAQRLEAGPLPIPEVLRLGIQIADALENAHGNGIVHRDLKPGNIMLTERGVKLLDFGLAKLHVAGAAPSGVTMLRQAATEAGSAPLTTEGTLLGTFQYMAPEQLEGREADAASDIFALGAVLYEMATGQKAFSGKSQASLIGSIMHSTPAPVSSVAPLTPPVLDRVVATCLAKDPRDRWQTAHDVRLQLQWIAEGGSIVGLPAPVASRRRNRERLAWSLVVALALATAAVTAGYVRRAPPPPRIVRFEFTPPATLTASGAPMISPDGRRIAFVGTDAQARNQIWIRGLESIEARPLAGTEGVAASVRPFWSPDSRHLGYFVSGRLMKIPVDGGPPQKICDTPINAGDGTWSEQGVILFDGAVNDPIRRVDAGGGVARVEREGGDGGEAFQVAWPQFLPDGRHYLFIAFGGADEQNGLYLAELGGGEPRKLVDGLSRAELSPPDRLIFVRESTLVTQRLDAEAGALVGDPVPLAEGLGITGIGLAEFSASRNGILVYRAGQREAVDLVWLDLQGEPIADAEDPGDGSNPAFSPDGRWLAVDREESRSADIWLRDLKRGVSSRLTTDPKPEYAPLFTPDGHAVLFSREEVNGWAIVERSLDSSRERVLVPPAELQHAIAITPDGRRLLYALRAASGGGTPSWDLWSIDLAGGEGAPYAASQFNENRGAFSPDGRWLAYQSNESGRNEIYVQSFPEPGRKWQISTEGGGSPVWARSGRELYYLAADRKLTRVAVTTAPGFDAGVPESLFQMSLATTLARNLFAFTPDERRILAVTSAGGTSATPMTVVLDWHAALDD